MVDPIRIPEGADLLNHACACRFTDDADLDAALGAEHDAAFVSALRASRPHLFAAQPVFITRDERATMAEVVRVVERLSALPAYMERALGDAPAIAAIDHGERGVLFGYDFHLADDGPKLIEINTNAGGSMLALPLARAQTPCCDEIERTYAITDDLAGLEERFFAMFRAEHARVRREGASELLHVAIVDETPETQFLAPELTLFARLFEARGVRASILAPSQLVFDGERLRVAQDGAPIDLVYNRLTDFMLEGAHLAPIANAYAARAVALTPNPRAHALFADKTRLVLLSDPGALAEVGATPAEVALLTRVIPQTQAIESGMSEAEAERWWADRKSWFFKPRDGFGSRAAYRGDKLTKRVWDEILHGGLSYVAQRLVPPRERLVRFGGEGGLSGASGASGGSGGGAEGSEAVRLKYDIRNYAFEGEVLLLAARLYQGQTTNFRTERGGFAAVFTER